MNYLLRTARQEGVQIEAKAINRIEELFTGDGSVIVNCSGIGSLDVLSAHTERKGTEEPAEWQHALHAARGQILLLANQNHDRLIFIHTGSFTQEPFYVVPRIDDVVLGGSYDTRYVYARGHASRLDLVPMDPAVFDRIRTMTRRLCPELDVSDRAVQTERVGLRPCRVPLRVEIDRSLLSAKNGHVMVHHYGHGGAGVTLSWGSAGRVVELVTRYG